jgi:cell division protein ZapE
VNRSFDTATATFRMRHPRKLDNPVSAAAFRRAASAAGLELDASQLAAAEALEHAGSSGVYLWGPVGRGKSWLMDTYLQLSPAPRKRRFHFHGFFTEPHTELHRTGHRLDDALENILGGLDVVCFDGFQVDDPADGIFVRRLLDALLARSSRLILTSNQPPHGLMPNPLFHSMSNRPPP